jgi:LPXTG-site transpeptidase (sortase) family protein
MKQKIGSLLIIFSILLLVFIYYPFIQVYYSSPNLEQVKTSGNYIYIPSINAASIVVLNIDPWNAKEYEIALKKGVAKAKGYDNFYFAHSSLPPWEMTRVNSPFLKLTQLKIGDEIIIAKDGVEKKYNVSAKKEIWPTEVEVLDGSKDQLILQTCTPPGTDWKRLLVFATPVN